MTGRVADDLFARGIARSSRMISKSQIHMLLRALCETESGLVDYSGTERFRWRLRLTKSHVSNRCPGFGNGPKVRNRRRLRSVRIRRNTLALRRFGADCETKPGYARTIFECARSIRAGFEDSTFVPLDRSATADRSVLWQSGTCSIRRFGSTIETRARHRIIRHPASSAPRRRPRPPALSA